MQQANVREFFQKFPTDEACLAHLFETRFGQGCECPKCERAAKWYPLASEKAFSCQWCGHHIHPMVGTIFEKSRTPLQLWFYAMFLFTTRRHGVSAKELQRRLGVTYKTAWRMASLIREHMAGIDGETPIGGEGKVVEVDETYVGGYKRGAGGRQTGNKTVVFGVVERDGDVMVKVVPNVKKKTLQTIIKANVEAGATIHADEWVAYDGLGEEGCDLHRFNKDRIGKYVGPNGETVNAIENFWRHLKCSIKGAHVSVSPKYLERCAKAFE